MNVGFRDADIHFVRGPVAPIDGDESTQSESTAESPSFPPTIDEMIDALAKAEHRDGYATFLTHFS